MNRSTLAVLLALSASGLAAAPIDETIDARGAERLDIVNTAGTVTVVGADRDDVQIRGDLSDDAEELDIRRDGNRIIVHVINRDRNRRGGNIDYTVLEIAAPSRLDLEINTVSASISVDEMLGEQDLNAVSGSIETAVYGAELHAATVSGRIEVAGRNVATRAEVSSVSGRVELDAVAGEVEAQTVSGSIDITSAALDRAELNSVSGSIDIDAALAEDGRLTAVTTSGSISVNLAGSRGGSYELSSFSGRIRNCFGPAPQRPRFGPATSALQFDEAGGRRRIDVTSMSGSIELCDR